MYEPKAFAQWLSRCSPTEAEAFFRGVHTEFSAMDEKEFRSGWLLNLKTYFMDLINAAYRLKPEIVALNQKREQMIAENRQ
jgi:hypothetical protein